MEWIPVVAATLALLAPIGANTIKLIKHLARVWLRAQAMRHTGKDLGDGEKSDDEPDLPPKSIGGPRLRKRGAAGKP